MTTPQEPLVLDAVLARNERASDTVAALCNGTERWVMRVPAQPDRDPDLVISASLSDVPALVTELTQARDEAAELRAAVQAFVDKYFQPGSKADRPDYSLMVTAADVFALREALRVRERATVARDDAAELMGADLDKMACHLDAALLEANELRAALAEVMRVIGQHDDRGPHILPTAIWQRARAALDKAEGES